jgi:hypothetical protein
MAFRAITAAERHVTFEVGIAVAIEVGFLFDRKTTPDSDSDRDGLNAGAEQVRRV